MGIVQFCIGLGAGMGIVAVYFYNQKRKWVEKSQLEATIFQLVESSKDIIYYNEVTPVYQHRYTSPSVDVFLGEGTLKELNTDPNKAFKMIHPEDQHILQQKLTGEVDYSQAIIQRLQHQDGSYRYFEEHATPIYKDGKLIAIQGIMRNIDEKMKLQQKLEYQLSHDALTHILNRRSYETFVEKFDTVENKPVAIFLCDVDELKLVNDHLGHKKGDELIQEAAKFLKGYFKKQGLVARIGGDEFAIILADVTHQQARARLEGLSSALTQYNALHRSMVQLSVGYAYSDASFGMMEALSSEADAHMYAQKRAKKRVCLS